MECLRYLGCAFSYDNNAVPTMCQNLKQARATWGRIPKRLAREEVPTPTPGMCYQMLVSVILLHTRESWVLASSGLRVLEGFHVEVTRRMAGIRLQRRTVRA